MIPKIAHIVWIGSTPLPEIYLRQMDFLGRLGFSFYLWHEPTLHQLGLEVSDVSHSSLAGSSNIIRLHALMKHGGLYFDGDVEWLKDPSPLLENRAFAARQPDRVFCNAVMGAEPESPWIKRQIELLNDFRLRDAAHACHIMERAVVDELTVLPTNYFYPWNWDEKPDRSKITDETYAIHHWEGSWLK